MDLPRWVVTAAAGAAVLAGLFTAGVVIAAARMNKGDAYDDWDDDDDYRVRE